MRIQRLVALLAYLLILVVPGHASAKSYSWKSIESTVQVQQDGTLNVAEKLTLAYTDGTFTFAYRDLPNRRLDAIRNIAVRQGTMLYRQVDDPESTQPYTFSVTQNGSTQRVRWVYPPTGSGTRTFTISYVVDGAIRRFDDHDQIWWSMVFADRDGPMQQAIGRITLPQAVPQAQLRADTPDSAGSISLTPGSAAVAGTNIAAGQELTLRLDFPKGVVAGPEPAWQSGAAAEEQFNSTLRPQVDAGLWGGSGLLALLFGGAGVWWWRKRRDPQPGSVRNPTPEQIAPGVAGWLAGSNQQAMLATIFDLANRGVISIREEPTAAGKSSLIAVHNDVPSASLSQSEQLVLQTLFDGQREAEWSKRQSALGGAASAYGALVQQEAAAQGLYDASATGGRKTLINGGLILLLVGALALIVALVMFGRYTGLSALPGGALALIGVVWLMLGASIRGITRRGADLRADWQAFSQRLRDMTPTGAQAGQFANLLPYATAFGSADKLIGTYAQTPEPLPGWYQPDRPLDGAGVGQARSLQQFGTNFQTMFVALSSSATPTPATSGASGGGGGAG